MTRETIDYVDLASHSADQPAACSLERLVGDTLPTPWADPPHRHNYQELIVIESGRWRHSIDGQVTELAGPMLALIARGQVHMVEAGAELHAWIVRFTDDFLPASLISPSWNYHATLFNQLGAWQTLALTPSALAELRPMLELFEQEYAQPAAFQQGMALRHLLAALIIRIERIYRRALTAAEAPGDNYRIYQQFMAQLEAEFTRHHDVEFYAGALGIAPVRLSKALSSILGKPTKQLIAERLLIEAKRYLQYTSLSVTEIAAALGYADMFHFSKAFKRASGLAPQVFREQQKMT